MDARLKILSGPHVGETLAVFRKLLIGRETDCDLRLESEFVSGHHCVLLLDDFTLRIRDLASKNGTFVNGRQIGARAMILLHDDTISIGELNALVDLTQTARDVQSTPQGFDSTVLEQATTHLDGETVKVSLPSGIPAEHAVPRPDSVSVPMPLDRSSTSANAAPLGSRDAPPANSGT